jgi:small conductance mechanosensitive channel
MSFLGASNVRAELIFILAGILVFAAFFVAARLVASRAAKALHRRGLRHDVVVIGTRVIVVLVIGIGALAGFSFALQSGNVVLAGIVVATIVASFGVQDVLKDYVSGYYVLLERHIKVGDTISLDLWSGTVVEIKLRVTLLRNESGHTVVVPNSELFNRPVTIQSRPAASAAAEIKPAPPE